MSGDRSRALIAAATLFVLLVVGLSPTVSRVVGASPADSHACCPETIRQTAAEGHQAGAQMPCCAIGNTRPPAPVRAAAPVRGATWAPLAAPNAHWYSPAPPVTVVVAASTAPLGQIPPLLQTSVLLI